MLDERTQRPFETVSLPMTANCQVARHYDIVWRVLSGRGLMRTTGLCRFLPLEIDLRVLTPAPFAQSMQPVPRTGRGHTVHSHASRETAY